MSSHPGFSSHKTSTCSLKTLLDFIFVWPVQVQFEGRRLHRPLPSETKEEWALAPLGVVVLYLTVSSSSNKTLRRTWTSPTKREWRVLFGLTRAQRWLRMKSLGWQMCVFKGKHVPVDWMVPHMAGSHLSVIISNVHAFEFGGNSEVFSLPDFSVWRSSCTSAAATAAPVCDCLTLTHCSYSTTLNTFRDHEMRPGLLYWAVFMHMSPNTHPDLSKIRHTSVFQWPLSSVWLAHRPWCCYLKTCWRSISV